MSAAEAARDFPGLLARVRAGAEVVIEDPSASPVVLRPAAEPSLRRLSESLRLAKEYASTATLDSGFGKDLEAVLNSHPESLENPWA
jgi:hypothetical protein